MFVEDATGTHRDEYLLTTDTGRSADAIVGSYCGRWNIETTFQECRSCLGLETTRGWSRRTVLRAAPCPFGPYSVVALTYHLSSESERAGGVEWEGKSTVKFSDALRSVRRRIWTEGVFRESKVDGVVAKLPANVQVCKSCCYPAWPPPLEPHKSR